MSRHTSGWDWAFNIIAVVAFLLGIFLFWIDYPIQDRAQHVITTSQGE